MKNYQTPEENLIENMRVAMASAMKMIQRVRTKLDSDNVDHEVEGHELLIEAFHLLRKAKDPYG